MNRAVLEVRELIGEVRKDPRKYLERQGQYYS